MVKYYTTFCVLRLILDGVSGGIVGLRLCRSLLV